MDKEYQIVYLSEKSGDFDADRDLSGIVKSCYKNNNARDITGALVYSGGFFFQVLEGKKDDVIYTYNKILLDSRHKNVHLLSDREISNRVFGSFPMALVKLGIRDIGVVNRIIPWQDLVSRSLSNDAISEDKLDRLIEALRYKVDLETMEDQAA